jgi:hypothetical protein
MQLAKGTFEVKLTPLAFEGEAAGSALGRMSIDKQIAGDLVGSSKGQMLSAFTGTQGSAGYVAIERVEGALAGRAGSFVLQHNATMNRGVPSLSVTVVPDSGTGALAGLAGDFKIIVADGKHSYEFSYALP